MLERVLTDGDKSCGQGSSTTEATMHWAYGKTDGKEEIEERTGAAKGLCLDRVVVGKTSD